MGIKNDLSTDPLLEQWLGEFKKESTREVYYYSLVNFKNIIGIHDLGAYVASQPDVTRDVRRFLAAYDGKPSKTISTYAGAVKSFLQDHGLKVPEDEWRKIRRRGFLPKRVRAETQDRKNSKAELKQILNYANIKCRAQVLFMVSAGTRLGETLQLRDDDLNLDHDPPQATIRSEYTKGGVGGRTVYFSYEGRDAIRDWLAIRDKTVKRTGGTWKSNRVFPWSSSTATYMWNQTIEKAGLNARDNKTNRRVYHLHGLRNFFKSNIGLEENMTEALMGHVGALDRAYVRFESGEIAEAYKEAMPNVTIFTVEVEDQHTVKKIAALEEENADLRQRIAQLQDAQASKTQTLELNQQRLERDLAEVKQLLKGLLQKADTAEASQ